MANKDGHDGVIRSTTAGGGRGKNLMWNEEETMALVRAAAAASTDPTVGSSMSAAEHGRRIRAIFIKDNGRPNEACTLEKSGCRFDRRRWDGRSADGCRKFWDKIRAECTRFKACYDRVIAMKLTGNPDDDALLRCGELLYSDGSNSISHLYDCVRNPHYHVSKPFKYKMPFQFLNAQTTMLQACGVGKEVEPERPMGTKAAKAKKEEERKDANKGQGAKVNENSVADSMHRIETLLRNSVSEKALQAKQKLALQQERLDWEMAMKLLSSTSVIAQEEKDAIERLMRKRLLKRLERHDSEPQSAKKSKLSAVESTPHVIFSDSSEKASAETLLELSTGNNFHESTEARRA
ncbi:hypothetical protein FGB62_190g016 [Gracilaria domingensis]|nr:hypothetical protein FGB62_190g016 [Gracilaria domingensis]